MTTQNASTCVSGWISCRFSPINSSKLLWQVPPVRTFGLGIWRGKPWDRPSDVTGYWHRISRIHWWMSFGAIHYHSLIDRHYWRIVMLGLLNTVQCRRLSPSKAAAKRCVAWKDNCLAPENSGPCNAVVGNVEMRSSSQRILFSEGQEGCRGKWLELHVLFACFFSWFSPDSSHSWVNLSRLV